MLQRQDGGAQHRACLERAIQVLVQRSLRKVLGAAEVVLAATAPEEDA